MWTILFAHWLLAMLACNCLLGLGYALLTAKGSAPEAVQIFIALVGVLFFQVGAVWLFGLTIHFVHLMWNYPCTP